MFCIFFLISYFQFFGSVPIRWPAQPGNGGKARLGSKAGMPPESSSWNIHAYWRCLHSEILIIYLCTQVGIPPVKDSWLELIEIKHGKQCTAFSVYDTVNNSTCSYRYGFIYFTPHLVIVCVLD